MSRWLWIALLCALFASARLASAQDQPPCRACGGTGLVACAKCGKDRCALEHEVLFCSIAAQCKVCGGTKLELCKCKQKPAVDLEAKRAALRAWLDAKAAPVSKFMGRE